MANNLNLKNIDDLIYLEGSSIDNINKDDIANINTFYSKRLNTNKKQIKNNQSLFLYDYRPSPIDFSNPDWKKEEAISIENPAIQPHDSRIQSINLKENVLNVKGSGNSYMNYENYHFEINFHGLDNLLVLESHYSNFKKDTVKNISLEDLNLKLSGLSFREVFLDQSATLKPEINLVFVDYNEEDIDKEKRNIIVITFEYDSVNVNCEHIVNTKKINKKF